MLTLCHGHNISSNSGYLYIFSNIANFLIKSGLLFRYFLGILFYILLFIFLPLYFIIVVCWRMIFIFSSCPRPFIVNVVFQWILLNFLGRLSLSEHSHQFLSILSSLYLFLFFPIISSLYLSSSLIVYISFFSCEFQPHMITLSLTYFSAFINCLFYSLCHCELLRQDFFWCTNPFSHWKLVFKKFPTFISCFIVLSYLNFKRF